MTCFPLCSSYCSLYHLSLHSGWNLGDDNACTAADRYHPPRYEPICAAEKAQLGYMAVPLVGTCLDIAVFLRPKDEEAGIKILHIEFLFFAIISEIASAMGLFQDGNEIYIYIYIDIERFVLFTLLVHRICTRLEASKEGPATSTHRAVQLPVQDCPVCWSKRHDYDYLLHL